MTQVTLQYPLDRDGQTVSTVTVRRPTGGDMIAIGDHLPVLMSLAEGGTDKLNASVFTAMVDVAGALTGLGADASRLDFDDLQNVVTAGLGALGNSPAGPPTTG